MAMLDRYKKKGGFIQLLLLIETSTKQKQEQFLNLIAQENRAWEESIKKKTLSIEKILLWDPIYLAEIFSRMQPLTIAVALRSFSEPHSAKVLNCFTPSEQRKIQNIITETNPSPSEILTCNMKIIAEVRELMRKGVLKLEKIDPEMLIPENIEEQLQQQSSLHGVQSLSIAPASAEIEEIPKVKPEAKVSGEPKLDTEVKVSADSKTSADARGNYEALKDEVELLKVKNRQLMNENQLLKEEMSVIKTKLEQIRKIA